MRRPLSVCETAEGPPAQERATPRQPTVAMATAIRTRMANYERRVTSVVNMRCLLWFIQYSLAGVWLNSRSFWISNPRRLESPSYRALRGDSVYPTPPNVKTTAYSIEIGAFPTFPCCRIKAPIPQHRLGFT